MSAVHSEKGSVHAVFEVSIDHLFDDLESGKRNYCFGKKSGKSLEVWIQSARGRNMQRDLECFPFRPKFWKFCLEIKWNGPFRFGPTGIVFWLTFIHFSLLFPFFSQYGCFVSCLQVQYGRHQGISVRILGTPHPLFLYHLRPEGPKRFFFRPPWRIERDGISEIKFEAARIQFLSDVFKLPIKY